MVYIIIASFYKKKRVRCYFQTQSFIVNIKPWILMVIHFVYQVLSFCIYTQLPLIFQCMSVSK